MKKVKNNKKILNIVLLIIALLFSSIAGVYAERIIASSNVTYNNSTSGLSSTNVQGAVDELYSKYAKCVRNFGNFICYLQSLEKSSTVVADDGTTNHNMRYTGKTPNNYITFNGELWRVIGVFNDIDNGTGKKETRVKIIKAVSIGNKQWNSNENNTWKNATLNTELQSLSYATNSLIENAVWYLGDSGSTLPDTKTSYIKERGSTAAGENNPTWTGKVGLMYPSDYGFASSACKDSSITLRMYNSTNPNCIGTDWLYVGENEWTISPHYGTTDMARHLYSTEGFVGNNYTTRSYAVRPVVYLKSSVICKNCYDATAGTQSNPFQIG